MCTRLVLPAYDIRIDEPILDVLVSASQRKKAYKFLNIFFEGIEALSGHISVECFYKGATIIQIGRVTWELKLTEPKLTRRHLDQKDSSPMAPLHQRVSSGMLELELVNKATNGVINYSEQKVSLLQQLPDVFDELRDQYVAIDSKIRAEEKKKAMAAEKKEQEKENKQLKERERQLQVEVDNKNIELKQEIYKHIEEFENITKVNKYLENIKKSSEDTEYEKIINQYSEQVERVLNLNDFSKKLEDWVERIKFMGND